MSDSLPAAVLPPVDADPVPAAWPARRGLRTLFRRRGMAHRIADSFFNPPRHVSPPMLPQPSGCRRVPVPGWPAHLNLRSWGEGAAVLLVHGWGHDHHQMTPLVEPMLACGYRVLALDLPAHGRSAGLSSHVVEAAAAVAEVARAAGPLHAVVAQAEGAAALAVAVADGLPVERVVLLSPATDPLAPVWAAARRHGLDAEETDALRQMLEARLGRPVAALNLVALAPHLSVPALVVQASDDPAANLDDVFALVAHWGDAELHLMAVGGGLSCAEAALQARALRFLLRRGEGDDGLRDALAGRHAVQATPWARSRKA